MSDRDVKPDNTILRCPKCGQADRVELYRRPEDTTPDGYRCTRCVYRFTLPPFAIADRDIKPENIAQPDPITWARGVLEAATPGPWRHRGNGEVLGTIEPDEYDVADCSGYRFNEDARAIALAVNTSSALLGLLEAADDTKSRVANVRRRVAGYDVSLGPGAPVLEGVKELRALLSALDAETKRADEAEARRPIALTAIDEADRQWRVALERRADEADERAAGWMKASTEWSVIVAAAERERDEARAEVDGLQMVEAMLRAEIERLRFALRCAVAVWNPGGDPGGDGADGETYALCMEALGEEAVAGVVEMRKENERLRTELEAIREIARPGKAWPFERVDRVLRVVLNEP